VTRVCACVLAIAQLCNFSGGVGGLWDILCWYGVGVFMQVEAWMDVRSLECVSRDCSCLDDGYMMLFSTRVRCCEFSIKTSNVGRNK
jgi:hypothetical protein